MGFQILKAGSRRGKPRGPGGPPPFVGCVALIVALVLGAVLAAFW